MKKFNGRRLKEGQTNGFLTLRLCCYTSWENRVVEENRNKQTNGEGITEERKHRPELLRAKVYLLKVVIRMHSLLSNRHKLQIWSSVFERARATELELL